MDRDPETRSYLNYPLLSSETPSQPASPAGSESRAAAASWGWNGNGRSQGVPVPPGGSGGYLAPSESPTGYSHHNDVAQPPAAEPGVIRRAQSSRRLQGKQGNVVRETRARKSTWLLISEQGLKSFITADKRAIIQRLKLGIPIRDMRLMDPSLVTSDTGKILVRDNAIVFSVEHVRLIITADAAIVPREGFAHNPYNQRFNAILEDGIVEAAQEAMARERSRLKAEEEDRRSEEGSYAEEDFGRDEGFGAPPLPFELHVLELALGEVVQLCAQLVKDLEAVAHPALDALTKQVDTPNLERVRKVKTRHQRLFTRVTTVREELQRFLEDDDDMMKMCLTRKKELDHAASAAGNLQHTASLAMASSLHLGSGRRQSGSFSRPPPQGGSPGVQGNPFLESNPSGPTPFQTTGQAAMDDESESIEAVENLLESYFMQVDSTYDRLVSIGEYIKDTEEYINIELDSSRNKLIKLEIIITAATFSAAIYAMVAGILGENLVLPESITHDLKGFWIVNGITAFICFLFFYAIIAYLLYRKLI